MNLNFFGAACMIYNAVYMLPIISSENSVSTFFSGCDLAMI